MFKKLFCWLGGHIPLWTVTRTLEVLGLKIVCHRCKESIHTSERVRHSN